MRLWIVIAAATSAAFVTVSASAQLVVGTNSGSAGNVSAYYIDLSDANNVVAKPLWAWSSANNNGAKVNGLAADPVNGKLFSNNAARLNVRNYGAAQGVVPTTIAGLYRSNGTTTSATGFDDLCFANGQLYGWTAFGSTTFKRGIYQIPTTPNASNQLITTALWTDTNTPVQYDFKGLCYDVISGKFIGLQNPVTNGAVGGIYSIDAFGSGTVTKLADLPTGRTEVDGLAIGGGRWWLTEKDRASQNIYIYAFNPATSTYTDTYQLAYPDSAALASGATWAPGLVPEPSALAGVALLAGGLARRRK